MSRPEPRIDDYAIIGDCRAAALVSRTGAIDWLCWPRFDSPSIFGALLDPGWGSWSVRPVGPFRVTRSYAHLTNVLETRFETDRGAMTVTDFMPVASEEEKARGLAPEHQVVRILEGAEGEIEAGILVDARPDFGRSRERFRDAGRMGLRLDTGHGVLHLGSTVAWSQRSDGSWTASATLRPGDAHAFSLTFAHDWPAVIPPVGDRMQDALAQTMAWWRRWIAACRYDGPGREAVLRSALVLKLLAYAPSGAIVAAPTTSLPERIGGDLNWDYRYCWLRDASLTARALLGLGFEDEARAFVSWLLHSTRLSRRRLRILYDVFGRRPPRERELDHAGGHQGSRPVRIGNGASGQLQLDVYGEVLEAVAALAQAAERLDRETAGLILEFGETVCRRWREPDEGIWEPRSGRAHHTHSRLLCWVALDRILALAARGLLPRAPVDRFHRERDLIRREIEIRGWNEHLRSYTGRLDGDQPDASLLLMPWYGFEEAGSARMRSTYDRIRADLGANGSLLYRYRDGESPGEGAFGIAGFWGVEYLALGGGTVEEAREAFESLAGYANDVGLLGEEIDPVTGGALGNFPQGFSHIGLINAALSLDRRLAGKAPMSRVVAGRRATRQESEAPR